MTGKQYVRYEGSIAMYNRDRGFGFIHCKNFEEPLWFHYTYIQGAENSDLYTDLHSLAEVTGIPVSFLFSQGDRGPQARSIRRLGPFAEMEDLLISAGSSTEDVRERFLDLVSMQALAYIDTSQGLSQSVVSRVIRSATPWGRLSALARQWMTVSSLLTSGRFRVEPAMQAVTEFSSSLSNCLGFEVLSSPDLRAEIPAIIQPLVAGQVPLRCFREAQNVHLVVLPDSKALEAVLRKNLKFIRVENNQMRMVVLLDETDTIQELTAAFPDLSVMLVSQRTIVEAVLNEERLPRIVGRNLRTALPLYKLQPYEVGAAYNESVFAGRSLERARILEVRDSNHAIYGGRKIGKTWFLKDICYRCQEAPFISTYYPLYVSLQSAENVSDAVEMIQESIVHYLNIDLPDTDDPVTRLGGLLHKTHRVTEKTVLLALDEIDDVLRLEGSYRFFGRLRQIQHTFPGAFKYIFAGFKELIRRLHAELSNDPFANWIGKNHFALGCLTEMDLQSLIVAPLQWLGFDFQPSLLVEKVFELTSGHPYYTQALCSSIVTTRSRASTIDNRNIERLASEEFFHDIFDIFTANLSTLQLLIGKIFTEREGAFSDSDIVEAFKRRFDLTFDERRVRQEMTILQACSVFTREGLGYKPLMQRINKEFFTRQDDYELALRYLESQERGEKA